MRVARTGATAIDLSYTHDVLGRVDTITDAAVAGQNRGFGYDGLGRLTSATGPWGTGSFTYDALNNLTRKTLGTRVVEMNYNSANRLYRHRDTAAGNVWQDYSYDSRGNVTDNGPITFTYDRSERPVSISGAATGSFAYDAHGRRVKQTIGGETIYSVYSRGGTLLYRHNVTTGEATDYIRMGGRTIARVTGTAVEWPHQDHLGSPVTATNLNGNPQWREYYTPFGERLNNAAANADDESFTGHIADADTGLVYMQARYYDPAIGRFLSSDPVGFASGGPAYFNRYAYVANDPVNAWDPTGMACAPANGWSAFCQRAYQYQQLDRMFASQTRFFAAASMTTAMLASMEMPVGNTWFTSRSTRTFMRAVSGQLERLNFDIAYQLESGALSGSNLDAYIVRQEQNAVQGALDGLRASDPKSYESLISEVNGLLNGEGYSGLAGSVYSSDREYQGVLDGVREQLGGDIDFANQDHREAIGMALIEHVRDATSTCTTGSRIC